MNRTLQQDSTPYFAKVSSWFLCAIPIIIACASLFIMGVHHIPVNDDVVYQYTFGEDGFGSTVENEYTVKVDSFDKLIRSQVFHYMNVNGRAIIHVLIQFFAGMLDYNAFLIFITLILGVTIVLFVKYTCPPSFWGNPLIYALASVSWLYLYPTPIGAFYWIVYGLNYLYPMLLVICFCILFNKCIKNDFKTPYVCILLIPVGFIVGWSHEGYSLPLSCATFIYLLINRRSFNLNSLLLAAALWIGTAILVVSPGNFNRLGSTIIVKILNCINILCDLRLFWLALIVIVATWFIKRHAVKKSFKNYSLIYYAAIFGFLFGLIANTGPWSMTGTEFFLSIILFSILSNILDDMRISTSVSNILSIIIITIISIHQILVIRNAIDVEQQQKQFISEFESSPYGYAQIPDISISPLVKPWIYNWFDPSTSHYVYKTLSVLYADKTKSPTPLGSKDYDALNNPDIFFIEENKVPGNSPFYEGDLYYWAKSEMVNDSTSFIFNYSPLKLSECPYTLLKIKAILQPNSFISSEYIQVNDITTPLGYESLKKLNKPSWRSVESITIK